MDSTLAVKDLVAEINNNGSMIVVKTSPGAAQMIARLLDSIGVKGGVMGCVAGDDTILVVPARVGDIAETAQRIADMFA